MRALSLGAAAAFLSVCLTACATAPGDAVRQRLDENTGVTVTHMAQPLEFYSSRPEAGLQATSFAYLGPLEVNRMGTRTTYLWFSVLPGTDARGRDAGALDLPQQLRVVADREPFELSVTATGGREIDLGSRAYRRPASWASEAYLSVSPELLGRLAAASKLFLEIGAGDGSVRRYELWKTDLTGLKAFVAQIQADSR